MKLTIALATRRRPGILVRTVQQTLSNITNPDTRIVILADADDDGTVSVQSQLNDPRIIWSIEPRPDSVGEKYNRAIKVSPADVYMVHVDYAPQVTRGFDDKVLEAATVYPDGYAIVLGHLANLSFSSINAVTHKMAQRMGGIYPEYFPYWFVDHWLEDMARKLGRQVFVDAQVNCSNKQPTIGKAEPFFWGCLFDWLHYERRESAEAIINSPDFDETPARKRALINNFALSDEWSFCINASLQNEPDGEIPDDERYRRIRGKAVEIIERAKVRYKAAA